MATVGDPRSDDDGMAGADRESFDAFYRREFGSVARLILVMTGRPALAEELAQEAFLAACQRWDRVSTYDDPAAWVRRVALNRATSMWRRATVEVALLARLRLERPGESTAFDADNELWDAVRALPTRQRQVIALRAIEDMSVAEIALVLECSTDTVRTHLRRARRTLAQRLDDGES